MAHKLEAATAETLTGARTLTLAEIDRYALWSLDPGGAGRNVTLPTAAAAAGHMLVLLNAADAAEVLTVKDGATTIVTPTQAEVAVLFSNGTTWFGIAGANS